MNILASKKRVAAISMVEVLVVLAVLLVLAALVWPAIAPARRMSHGPRITCVNNLHMIGFGFRDWENDHGGKYPMFVSETNGGAMEYTFGINASRQFLAVSNELINPKLLFCPAESDRKRFAVTNFNWLNNSNLSYFIGIVSNETNPQMILSGDHNVTNGVPVKNGLLALAAGQPIGWTREMHNEAGNVLFSDGSVQQLSSVGLQNSVTNTGVATNLIQMPILGP